MTNEAILSVLDNVCNEARKSAHAAFGLMELHRNAGVDSTLQACLEISRSSADRLLRSINDLRELLSKAPAAPDLVEEVDLALCLSQTVELLKLASGERAARIHLEASREPLIVRQDRQAVEEVLMRTLDAASKLTGTNGLHVAASAGSDGNVVQVAIRSRNPRVAVRLADWLNADPGQAGFQNAADATIGVAVMVAGKHLRAQGGTAELVHDPGEPAHLAIQLHSQPDRTRFEDSPQGRRQMRPDGLNILLTEDSDDSYALTELLFQNENVWRARTGLEAIDLVQKRRFDVVFMDVHMPGMDGYTAIRAIRDWETLQANARTPIVVLSADDLETQRLCAARSGCSGFLHKPLRNEDLLDLLDRLKATRSLAL